MLNIELCKKCIKRWSWVDDELWGLGYVNCPADKKKIDCIVISYDYSTKLETKSKRLTSVYEINKEPHLQCPFIVEQMNVSK